MNYTVLHVSYSSAAVVRLVFHILLKSPPPLSLLAGSALVLTRYTTSAAKNTFSYLNHGGLKNQLPIVLVSAWRVGLCKKINP